MIAAPDGCDGRAPEPELPPDASAEAERTLAALRGVRRELLRAQAALDRLLPPADDDARP